MKKYKILVIPSDKSGCGYFRSTQPHLFIAEKYQEIFDVDIMYELPELDKLNDFIKQYDLVHIHKRLDSECKIIKLIKENNIKVIVDVDDHWDLGNDHPMSITARLEKWHLPIIEHLKLADAVSTTTNIFAKEIKKYNKNVLIFPNAINPNEEQFIPKPNYSSRLRFGIICGSSHLQDIKILQGITSLLSKDILDKIQFVLCGFDTSGNKTIHYLDTNKTEVVPIQPHESVWYQYEQILTDNYKIVTPQYKNFLHLFAKNVDYPFADNEPYKRCWTKDINHYATHYNDIDVLLVPLKENNFNNVKSQLKVVEAGFFHKAIIAQNFGPYTIDLISAIDKGGKLNPNGNALLVNTNKTYQQWAKYIIKLVKEPELLKQLQANLYLTVKDKYNIETVCQQRVNEYLKLLNK